MTLDPESAELLVQAHREAKRQGELAAKAEANQKQASAEVSVQMTARETWGEWFLRVTGRAKVADGAKPDASVRVDGGVKW